MRRLGLAVTLLALLLVPASAQARDRDRDKLPDRWEKRFHISTQTKSARQDPDRDGLSNLGEFRSKTNPRRKDTDRDGILDDDEDADRDRVDNENEIREGTRPRDRDSDDDGRADGREDRDRDGLDNADEDETGNDPIDADTDNDGVEDGDEQAGTVFAFDNSDGLPSMLTIRLAGGRDVFGFVTSATEIECETEDESEDHHGDVARVSQEDGDDSGPGDHSGPGGDDDDAGENDDGNCTVADLRLGAIIHEAEGQVVNGVLVFTEVEILKP
ncbi:MAG: Midasin [Thermoleophilaceae bacterium]